VNKTLPKYPRILAITPSTRGFGYAVLEGHKLLVDWGVRSIEGDKNSGSIKKVEEMIDLYNPQVIVLENTATKESRRSPRIKALTKRLVAVAESRTIKVALFSKRQVRRIFFGDAVGTKHALAEIIAERFPEELGFRLPPKRRDWMSEDSRMDVFGAVALTLAYFDSCRTPESFARFKKVAF
jgi:Holliday junction resolvasome RuvABC endonuclease subunit